MLKPVSLFLIVLSFVIFSRASDRNNFQDSLPVRDTSEAPKNDSVKVLGTATTASDPKSAFKDLFIERPDENETSGAQLNPMAISFVKDYMAKNSVAMHDLKDKGKPYFDMMDLILQQHNLPKELKYLAVIESNLQWGAHSWAGAVGPWQLMPATGRGMGLKISRKIDERTDLYKSTHAASKYLKSLFKIYGDWLLVIAAYNGGPGNVNVAIRKSGSRDFWELQRYLPAESRNHVKKFIATHYIMEGDGGVTTLTKEEVEEMELRAFLPPVRDTADNSIAENISGRYNSTVILKYTQVDLATFQKINPNFDRIISLEGKYELHLPVEKMELFKAKKFEILYESLQLLLLAPAGSKIN